jgi:hypothetical protein
MNVSPKSLLTTLLALSLSWSDSKGEIEDNNSEVLLLTVCHRRGGREVIDIHSIEEVTS